MPQLLRTVQANLWWRDPLKEWLAKDLVPADCVSDLKTRRNKLSVYAVSSSGDAERVVAALALQRAIGAKNQKKSLDSTAYMLFESKLLDTLGIAYLASVGETKDTKVNGQHLDLVELSGAQLAAFAHQLLLAAQPVTLSTRELLLSLKTTIQNGEIAKEALPSRVAEQLSEL